MYVVLPCVVTEFVALSDSTRFQPGLASNSVPITLLERPDGCYSYFSVFIYRLIGHYVQNVNMAPITLF